ncbi:MAG: hypothetical protein NT026_02335 [Candidatus Staskawiczbacteria bacterium]|nr:hypothetical protein [Candidatus Staskawiczbacteria bacterium]
MPETSQHDKDKPITEPEKEVEIKVDEDRLRDVLKNKKGWLKHLKDPLTMADFDRNFKNGEGDAFEVAAVSYGGDECYDYNNFWTRLEGAWAVTSAENLFKAYGQRIDTLETLAMRALGEKYPGPIKLQDGMTMDDVNKHFYDICKDTRENPSEDSGVNYTVEILSSSWTNQHEHELEKNKLYNDIKEICEQNGLGNATNLWEQYVKLRDSDGFDGKAEASGWEIFKSKLKSKMEIHQSFKVVYEKLLEKGYPAIDLYG